MKQQTVNEFKDGLNLDLHPLVTPKTVLTDNINGTFITYNGNEFCLQNDRGNKEVTIKQKLSTGYVPIGIKEHNGILYIVSHNPSIHKTEIGTYPGVNWNLQNGTLDDKKYTSLCNYYHKNASEHRYTIYSRYDSDELYDAGIEINEDDVRAIADLYGALYDGGTLFGDPGTGSDYIYFLDENVRDICFNAINTQFPNIFTTWELDEDVTGTLIPMQFTADYSLSKPVTIEVQDSYDGSVNLILVADNCKTRIINTGFSVKPNKQYELIARNQSVATNYYTVENFDKETELIRTSTEITNIDLIGVQSGGQFKGGNYTFYIKFGDADYNQTDVVAESGIVSVFNGNDGVPSTISGTLLDERTDKMIHLGITGLNHVYSKIYIYFSREYSDTQGYRMTEYGMFTEPIDMVEENDEEIFLSGETGQSVWLTGFEQTSAIDVEVLNVDYHTVDWARAETQHSNMLFLGNIGQEETFRLYRELKKFTLRTNTILQQEDLVDTSNGDGFSEKVKYYSVKNIYNSLGYWPEEWYRFAIVYILKDGSTTPAFNMEGCVFTDLTTKTMRNDYGVFKTPRVDVLYSSRPLSFKFTLPSLSLLPNDVKNKILGWFVVRQKRIPTTLCQGVNLKIDKLSHLPLVNNDGAWIIESFLSLNRGERVGERYWKNPKGQYSVYEGEKHILRPLLEFLGTKKLTTEAVNSRADYVVSKVRSKYVYFNSDLPDENGLESNYLGEINNYVTNFNANDIVIFEQGLKSRFDVYLYNQYLYLTIFNISYKLEDDEYQAVNTGRIIYFSSTQPLNSGKFYGDNVVYDNGLDQFSYSNASFYWGSDVSNEVISEYDLERYTYRFIEENGDNYYNGIGLLTLDPAVNNFVGSMLDGSKFKVCFEYPVLPTVNQNITSSIVINNQVGNVRTNFSEDYKCVYVRENTLSKVIDDYTFSNVAGSATDAGSFKYTTKPFGVKTDRGGSWWVWHREGVYEQNGYVDEKYGTEDYKGYNSTHNVNLVRGLFTPYVGIASNDKLQTGLYSIRLLDVSDSDNISIRQNDNSEYFTVTERLPIETNIVTAYRGDCYMCTVGMRILRNFIDPTAPATDVIVDPLSWEINVRQKSRYGGDGSGADSEVDVVDYTQVNLSDVNTVDLGYWVTFSCLSSYNLGLRSVDTFHTDEMSLLGSPRSFYPLNGASTATGTKVGESFLLNDGLSATVGRKRYNLMPDVPYSKSEFSNRIMFSNVNVTDSFTNGYRTFQGLSYKDYDKQYGAITKLISLGQNIFIVMEHGLGLVPVNPKALMQTTTGETIHIYGYGVLPDEMTIISQDYGSKYEHSVIRTPIGIYGIDVDAKKVWRFSDKQGFETISDMKIETYLKDFLSSREIEMGTSDIRTHYNGKKGDLMFAWYPRANENPAYMICYNERQNIWTTKYDWYPIVSENINDEFYSLKDSSIWDHADDVGYNGTHVSSWYDNEHGFEFEFVVSDPIGVNKIYDNLQIISNNVQPNEMEITIIGDDYEFKRDLTELTDVHKERAEYNNITNIGTTSNTHGDNTYSTDVWNYKYNNRLNQKAIVAYQKFKDIYKHGRRLGNIQYKEGSWYAQIDPLRFNINGLQLKKEVRIRDKWAKIRIRYTGKDLAVITAIRTLINI